MRNVFYLISSLVILNACTTVSSDNASKYRSELNGLEEMSFEYIESQWGKPDYELPTRSGKVLKYQQILGVDVDPVDASKSERLCTIRLELDKESIVTAWSYEECVDLKTGKAVEPNLRMPEVPAAPSIDTSSPIFDEASDESFSG